MKKFQPPKSTIIDYRLALDIGTNSIGWCIFEQNQILDIGTRIYTDGRDPQAGTSLAVDRREARSARRRQDRFLGRRKALLKTLVQFGLMPSDTQARKKLENLDPYSIRATALDGKLPLHHIGRAIFHLNQRRGFQSNRKADSKDSEKGKIATGVSRLKEAMQDKNARTYGEFLHQIRQASTAPHKTNPVRTRLSADGKEYDYYPSRDVIEDEFRQLWASQTQYHLDSLTQKTHDAIHRIIFYQRPLQEQKVGKCRYFPEEKRLRKADPLFQEYRLYEEVNSLFIRYDTGQPAKPLTMDQRYKIILKLMGQKDASFSSLHKHLKLPDTATFNKDTNNRDKLAGNETRAKLSHAKCFGDAWKKLPEDDQRRIVERLCTEQDEENLINWLMADYNLSHDNARQTARTNLPDGHGRIGETAARLLLEQYKETGVVYSDAVANIPEMKHHSKKDQKELDELPYYGEVLENHIPPGTQDENDSPEQRYGKFTNPTVHIGLNQICRLINGLIKAYGKPAEIVIELARDLKLSEKQKAEVNKKNAANRKIAEQHNEKLAEHGLRESGANRVKLKLWEELDPIDRRCVFTGTQISFGMLFDGSVEVEHILPFSKTLDDSFANKTLCITKSNRRKSNRSPFDAFYNDPDWPDILDRASQLPKNKKWRFAEDAMTKAQDEQDFLARHLTDTQYITRMAKMYVESVCPNTWAVPGKLTAMLRAKWGLNDLLPNHNVETPKNRLDHRHHAIDAAVVGQTDRATIQKISNLISRNEDMDNDKLLSGIEPPWEGFREELKQKVNAITVSHRPDHGTPNKVDPKKPKQRGFTAGKLHNDTVYGVPDTYDDDGKVVYRVPIDSFKQQSDLLNIIDEDLQGALMEATEDLSGKEFTAALINFARREDHAWPRLRRVKVRKPLNIIPIKDKTGKVYKGFKGDSNYRYDVWLLPNGKTKTEVISMFNAHQKNWASAVRAEFPNAKKIFRLQQNDMLAYEHPNLGKIIVRVIKFSARGGLTLAPHNESGALKARDADKDDPFKYINSSGSGLLKANARQVRVDALGRVFDPGPRINKKTSVA